MSGGRVLVTGGAGFIGSHVAAELLTAGWRVRALDCLHPQVHPGGGRPAYLDPDVELVVGDIRDRSAVAAALAGVDAVVHLAARVGVAQAMYELTEYASTNVGGTATLLEAMLEPDVHVGRLLVASSMSVYGEGRYLDADGGIHDAVVRGAAPSTAAGWDPVDAGGRPLRPVPTPEAKPPQVASPYALEKLHQEQLALLFGRAYGVPTTALRMFNVYGPNQALANPYTGVLAIFAARLLNGHRPVVFEDGRQRRDFVSVHDVARAFRLALEGDAAADRVLNVGCGTDVSIAEIATAMAGAMGRPDLDAEVTGQYRTGDVRHCFADLTETRAVLGFEAAVDLGAGIESLVGALAGATTVDNFAAMNAELARRGLTR